MHIASSPLMGLVSFWPPISLRVYNALHVKNKLRSYQVKNLKDIFDHVIHEDQKQMIRALDFGVSSKPDPILNCSINAMKDKACFKCGSEGHFIKDCPLRQQDNMAQKSKYTDQRTETTARAELTRSWSPEPGFS